MRRTLFSVVFGAIALGLLVSALGPNPLHGQSASSGLDRYLTHDELTRAVQGLVQEHRSLARVESLTRSDQGRDLWLLTLGNPQTGPLDSKPALLLVANLEGNHWIGSSTALITARALLSRYGSDEAVTELLDRRTVYIIPRANPDGAELIRTLPSYEIPFKPHPSDPAKGGLNARELGADLNGDGLVTLMRQRHPEGEWMLDPDEPRLLRRANRARAERGAYRIFVEGIDTTQVEAYIPMGSDGVNLNRNFPHDYLYFRPHSGPHQVSEVESRALADFLFQRENIAAVLTFSPYDNLRSPTPENRRPPEGVAPGPPTQPANVQPQDRPYFQFVSEQFQAITGLRGDGAEGEAGSFAQYAYYQVGIPAFTTPVWSLPAGSGDAGWLSWFDEAGVEGFVEWTPARHPQLGEVEVGGFRPNARVNPPVSQVGELAEKHAEFALWLGQQLPEVRIVETTVTPRGEGVWELSATVANESYFPTQTQMGQRVRFNHPLTVRLMPTRGMTVLTGNIQQQTPRIEGMGGRQSYTWLVQAPAGTTIPLEVFAQRAGGLLTSSITLR